MQGYKFSLISRVLILLSFINLFFYCHRSEARFVDPPSISSIIPGSGSQGSSGPVTIIGNNFIRGVKVRFELPRFRLPRFEPPIFEPPILPPVIFGSSKEISINIDIDRNLAEGTWTVIVINPDGQIAAIPFSVTRVPELTETVTILSTPFTGERGPGKTAESPDVTQFLFTPTAGEMAIDATFKKGTQAVKIFMSIEIPNLGKFFLFFKDGMLTADTVETPIEIHIVGERVITGDISVTLIGPPDPFGRPAIFSPSIPVSVLASVAKGTWKFTIELKDANTGGVVSTSTVMFKV